MTQLALMLVVLIALYGLIIAEVAWLLRRLGLSAKRAVFASFLVYGLGSGILAALLWPQESAILANFPGVLLGDWIYVHAIEWLGDPRSSQAHYTIPWVLQVPQVYPIASTGFCAPLGFLVQWFFKRSDQG